MLYIITYIIIYAIFYYVDNNIYLLSANDCVFVIAWFLIILFTLLGVRLFGYLDIIYDKIVYARLSMMILFVGSITGMIGLCNMYYPYNDFKEYYLSSDKNKIAIVKAYVDNNKAYIQPKVAPNQYNIKEINVVNTNAHNAVICLNFEEIGLVQGEYTIFFKVNNREYSKNIWYIVNDRR